MFAPPMTGIQPPQTCLAQAIPTILHQHPQSCHPSMGLRTSSQRYIIPKFACNLLQYRSNLEIRIGHLDSRSHRRSAHFELIRGLEFARTEDTKRCCSLSNLVWDS